MTVANTLGLYYEESHQTRHFDQCLIKCGDDVLGIERIYYSRPTPFVRISSSERPLSHTMMLTQEPVSVIWSQAHFLVLAEAQEFCDKTGGICNEAFYGPGWFPSYSGDDAGEKFLKALNLFTKKEYFWLPSEVESDIV